MSRPFIHEDFMLDNEPARRLYHGYAADMPIIDYHCHLPPEQVAEDFRFSNIGDVWLRGDHYKWRAMRSNGVPEKFCTGDATDREKFDKWAETMPRLLRNPLYHWTHLELVRYFGVTELLSPATADAIWEACNARMAQPDFSARGIMRQSGVVLVCTTDDPVDSLEAHRKVAADASFDIQMLPTWRPDRGMMIEDAAAFNAYVDRLAEVSDTDIGNFGAYLEALRKRHQFFHDCGCRLSDHGIEAVVAEDATDAEIAAIFDKVRAGQATTPAEGRRFMSAMLYELGVMDAEKDWTQQYHLGAMRRVNSRMTREIGPDSGFDSIGDFEQARPMGRLLDRLDTAGKLTRTILYNLNPADNYLIATMLGNFQDGTVAGKIQMGSGWWFLDQQQGMQWQIEALSQLGLLSRFVGMLTDSRSFLSYTRHEYFRRILCNVLGADIEAGRIPGDEALVGEMVRDICYNNAVRYFGFDLAEKH